jgi:hypothetical protein
MAQAVWVKTSMILDRRTWVYYLTVPEAGVSEWSKVIDIQPDEKFFAIVNQYAKAYVEKGEQPPDMIASAIVNFADDFVSKRDVTIRTGDYIAIQNFIRQGMKGAR